MIVDWEVKIVDANWKDEIQVFLIAKTETGQRLLMSSTGEGVPIRAPAANLEPTLKISGLDAPREFLEALKFAVIGFGAKDVGELRGQLEAMTRHLADMRHLVFKGNPPK